VGEGVAGVVVARATVESFVRQQQLGDVEALLGEGAGVGVHQLDWPTAAQACLPASSFGLAFRPVASRRRWRAGQMTHWWPGPTSGRPRGQARDSPAVSRCPFRSIRYRNRTETMRWERLAMILQRISGTRAQAGITMLE